MNHLYLLRKKALQAIWTDLSVRLWSAKPLLTSTHLRQSVCKNNHLQQNMQHARGICLTTFTVLEFDNFEAEL